MRRDCWDPINRFNTEHLDTCPKQVPGFLGTPYVLLVCGERGLFILLIMVELLSNVKFIKIVIDCIGRCKLCCHTITATSILLNTSAMAYSTTRTAYLVNFKALHMEMAATKAAGNIST